jgi:hypothetical protein
MIEQWYMANIEMLARIYGQVSYDDAYYTWIKVHLFDLPDVFIQRQTNLLMLTPGFNIDNYLDYNFFVDLNLQRHDGIDPPFIHEYDKYNSLYDYGYARLSFHLDTFIPTQDVISGDNLIGLAKAIYHFLGQAKE